MNKTVFAVAAAFLVQAAVALEGELKVTADRIAADQRTGSLVATGHVDAVLHPFHLLSEELTRDAENRVSLAPPTTLTTCTNGVDGLHWSVCGEAEYQPGRYVMFRDMWVRMWDVPVMWMPYWYYPFDTDYGLRMMPGYASRWGAYLLTKYVYHIAGDTSGDEGALSLRGATRMDLRTKSGIALGQSLRWRLGDFGKGWFKVYYAWDEDYDRYHRHWNDPTKWNYQNWGSDVSRDRYAIELGHRWEPTERDVVRARGSVYSDSYMWRDFIRDRTFGLKNPYQEGNVNELAWERNETLFGLGVSVSGPLNKFYGGTARLPELYLDVMPQPLFGLPVNYESESRLGYLDRRAARYGKSGAITPYSHVPGTWADYNTFRLDTYHRLTMPMRFWDVLSVVPRIGVRGTYWGESGYESNGLQRAGASGDDMARFIMEGGVTFAARGTAWIDDSWQHMIEPYADVLAQEAEYSGDGIDGNGRRKRPYVFDSLDASSEWQDQFAGRSRNLPYSWYGVTPGVRNAFRKADDRGMLRTILDVDGYVAMQLNDTKWTGGNSYHRLAEVGRPNYGKDSPTFVPGMRVRWFPDRTMSLSARAEYDAERNKLAYANLLWRQSVTDRFSYHVEFFGRNHRWWDFSSTPYDATVKNEDFNMAHFSLVEIGFEHEICDAVVWGPCLRWDCQEGELDSIGSWVDLRTDCLGFRFQVTYESDYVRMDGSKCDHDWRFGFYIYLRAFGPNWGSIVGD
jgi:hypothetical protein